MVPMDRMLTLSFYHRFLLLLDGCMTVYSLPDGPPPPAHLGGPGPGRTPMVRVVPVAVAGNGSRSLQRLYGG
jgi:hypothetical protein